MVGNEQCFDDCTGLKWIMVSLITLGSHNTLHQCYDKTITCGEGSTTPRPGEPSKFPTTNTTSTTPDEEVVSASDGNNNTSNSTTNTCAN